MNPDKNRLRRTMMFLNCQKPGLIKDPYIYEPDSIILDLEDAVAANQRVLHRMEDGAERVARLARRNVRKRVREFVCDFAARHHAAFGSVAHVSSLYVERSPYDIPSRRKTPSRRCTTPPGLETAFDLAEAS